MTSLSRDSRLGCTMASWSSVIADILLPGLLTVGAGFAVFSITTPRASDESSYDPNKHDTLVAAFKDDVYGYQREGEDVEEEGLDGYYTRGTDPYYNNQYGNGADLINNAGSGIDRDGMEMDINSTMSLERNIAPRDLGYVIDLLEKQSFSQELLLKQQREGVPEWANDLIQSNRDLIIELRALRKGEKGGIIEVNETKPANQVSSSSLDTMETEELGSSDGEKVLKPSLSIEERLDQLKRMLMDSVQDCIGSTSDPDSTELKSLKAACGMFIMYLTKIKDEPLVSRYKKVSSTNQNFVLLIQPLRNHEEIFKALGFEKKGSFYHYDEMTINNAPMKCEAPTCDHYKSDAKEESGDGRKVIDTQALTSVTTDESEVKSMDSADLPKTIFFLTEAIEIFAGTKNSDTLCEADNIVDKE